MRALLYRSTLDPLRGPGQLIAHQARGLQRAGLAVRVAGERDCVRFLLYSGIWARRATPQAVAARPAADNSLLVDHSMKVPNADVVFVHNLVTAADRYLPRGDFEAARIAQEAALFRDLPPSTRIVANSALVRQALISHFGLEPGRVDVLHPGFRSDRFSPRIAATLRAGARNALRVDAGALLVGFVTPGEFRKRGLDTFLDTAAAIAAAAGNVRFLVVGGDRLPPWAASHPLVRDGTLVHRPASKRPAPWFAALDLFLYAARYEEFGLVVAEAAACGVPVLTSRLVGAAESLPDAYAPWLLDEPDAARFAASALALLEDPAACRSLGAAGAAHLAARDHRGYERDSAAIVLKSLEARHASG